MRPLEDHFGVWVCTKHDLYATVISKEQADAIERGDPFPMPDGSEGVASRTGDERPNGVILYYRPKI
jgi:hypothetical protein